MAHASFSYVFVSSARIVSVKVKVISLKNSLNFTLNSYWWATEESGRDKMSNQIYCDLCPKTCASRQGLSYHKLTHCRVKKYICEQCNKSFGRDSDLKTHSLIHS